MAAFSNLHAFVTAAVLHRESMFDGRRGTERRTSRCAMMAARVAAAVGEMALFLWMLVAVALSLVVMAGFFVE